MSNAHGNTNYDITIAMKIDNVNDDMINDDMIDGDDDNDGNGQS